MIREGGSAAAEAANFSTSGEPSLRAPAQIAVFRLRPGISPIRLTEIRCVSGARQHSSRSHAVHGARAAPSFMPVVTFRGRAAGRTRLQTKAIG